MYKSPLTKDQIKATAAEVGVVADCFLRGGKAQIISNVIMHLNTMRMFSVIMDTPESLECAKKDEARRNLFISKAKVTDDGVTGLEKRAKPGR
jgi:hypothetical protein